MNVWLHVPQVPPASELSAEHDSDPNTQQLVPSHVVHCSSVALHEEQVESIAAHVPVLVSLMQYTG